MARRGFEQAAAVPAGDGIRAAQYPGEESLRRQAGITDGGQHRKVARGAESIWRDLIGTVQGVSNQN